MGLAASDGGELQVVGKLDDAHRARLVALARAALERDGLISAADADANS